MVALSAFSHSCRRFERLSSTQNQERRVSFVRGIQFEDREGKVKLETKTVYATIHYVKLTGCGQAEDSP